MSAVARTIRGLVAVLVVAALTLQGCGGGGGNGPPVPSELEQVVRDANNMFHSNVGAAFRVIGPVPDACLNHSCKLWELSPYHSNSFSILSNNSWSTHASRYSVFPGLAPNNRTGGWPGMLATAEAASSMIDCSFSGDGATGCRGSATLHGESLRNCGPFIVPAVGQCESLPALGGPGGWCTNASNITTDNLFCAFPGTPSDTKWMLETFLKRGGGDEGWGFTEYFGYNEALINRAQWNSHIPNSTASPIKAFVIPIECSPASSCYSNFTFWYGDYQKEHGVKPVIGFDGTRRVNPYTVIPQPIVSRADDKAASTIV